MHAWTHDELHALMDGDPILKAKSDKVHALPRNTPKEEEQGKLEMMEIYCGAVDCSQAESAKEYVREVFSLISQRGDWNVLAKEYAAKKLCHSPLGNDYACFCWATFTGEIVAEEELSITLKAVDGSEAVIKISKGNYRIVSDSKIDLRIGAKAEFLKYPKGCGLKRTPE